MTAPNGTRNGHSLTPRYPPSTPLVAAQRLSAIRQNLDGRYKPALRWDATAVELNAHVGGAPSATELRVIAAIADLEYHMGQVDERAVERGELNQHATREYLAWQNSRRRLLQQLGMAPLVCEFPDMANMAHPALAGAARIAPPLLLGKLFRLFGADATIFPNHGGRFGYSPETCQRLADAARAPWDGLKATVPVPAGGMTLDRVPEMLDFYGQDAMLLIGGALLAARERLTEETAAFARRVAR